MKKTVVIIIVGMALWFNGFFVGELAKEAEQEVEQKKLLKTCRSLMDITAMYLNIEHNGSDSTSEEDSSEGGEE